MKSQLRKDVLFCQKCPNVLHPCVPPEIKDDGIKVMIIGRNPGRVEYSLRTGPFFHDTPSGKLLDKHLSRISLNRKELWITNLVLGHTEGDRAPTDREIDECWPFLLRQISYVRPKIIASFGVQSSTRLLGRVYSWKNEHGKPVERTIELPDGEQFKFTVLPMTHTGQALRGIYYELEEDFDVLAELIKMLPEAELQP